MSRSLINESTLLVNPSLNLSRLNNVAWEADKLTHKRKSCNIEVSADKRSLRKSKSRKSKNRVGEFISLQVMNYLLREYRSIDGVRLVSPEPYYVGNGELVMENLSGVSIDRLLVPDSLEHGPHEEVLYALGQFLKIKENENLFHNDVQLRHFFYGNTGSSVGVIDLEHTCCRPAEYVAKEERKLLGLLDDDVGVEALIKGKDSVPSVSYMDIALARMANDYPRYIADVATEKFTKGNK